MLRTTNLTALGAVCVLAVGCSSGADTEQVSAFAGLQVDVLWMHRMVSRARRCPLP